MNLNLDVSRITGYKSGSQIARLVSEHWGASNLYCAACDSARLSMAPANTRAIDYTCPGCDAPYQLKSMKNWNERCIPDAAYDAMVASIRSDRTPNLLVMQYTPTWQVTNLMLIPSFFFSESAIQKRPPLGPNARRAGWVGCNILLSEIAPEGKLRLIQSGVVYSRESVRAQYESIRPLAHVSTSVRGWLLDVLNIVHRIGKRDFTLAEVYAFDAELAAKHPDNLNVRPKIRQKLQVLRDMGLIRFLGGGRYVLGRGQ